MNDRSSPKANVGFPATDWSEVRRAGDVAAGEIQREAVGRLWARYVAGLRAHLRARFGLVDGELEDALASFALEKVLVANALHHADRTRGRFRTFLLRALDNHVRNQLRDRQAECRMPPGGFIPLEDLEGTVADGRGNRVSELDVVWARAVWTEASQRMERECRHAGRADVWQVFEGRALQPLAGGEPVAYERLAAGLGVDTNACQQLLTTGKRMFRRNLSAVVSEFAPSAEVAEAELRDVEVCLEAALRGEVAGWG